MASKTTQRQHHPFNIRPGLRRIPLYDEGQLLDLIAKIRIGEPLVLIAVKLSDQTIAVHDGRKHLDINTTMYTTVGTTIIYRKGPVSKVAQKSRAEQLSETVVECSPMVATEHRIPLFYSSHDPLLQWLLTMVWQQYKTHIDALSNVIPDSAIACTEVGQENTSPRGVKSRPGRAYCLNSPAKVHPSGESDCPSRPDHTRQDCNRTRLHNSSAARKYRPHGRPT